MPPSVPARRLLQFGIFELDVDAGELRKQGIRVKLQDQPFKVLQLLLERAGQIVTREELRARVWPANTYVEFDQGLYSAMARLRDALGDSAESPRFVETLARRGYRFIAPITGSSGLGDDELQVEVVPQPENQLQRFIITVLAGLVGGALLMALILGFDIANARRWLLRTSTRPIRSVAVLPLENLSGDPGQDYFAEGMTDELITNLAMLGNLRVISRTSIMQYKGTKKTLPQIGRELNVEAVVEGSVVRSGDRVRITAQLVDTATDQHLWAASYDRDLRDVLLLQGEAARSITENIRLHLTSQQANRLSRARPVDPEAYDLYLRGRYYSQRITQPDIRKCIDYFQQSIEKDPLFADAYAGLADCYDFAGSFGVLSYKDAVSRMRGALTRALELDDTQAGVHALLGTIQMEENWNWTAAAAEFQRALELGPNLAVTHERYSDILTATGQTEAALSELRLASGLDPLSTRCPAAIGWALIYGHRFDEAIEQFRKVLELEPNHLNAHSGLQRAYLLKGMYEPSIEEMKWKFLLFGADSKEAAARVSELRAAYRVSGPSGYWQKRLQWDKQGIKTRTGNPYYVAIDYAELGGTNEAFSWLEQAYEQRISELTLLKVDPRLDPLRSDPRFGELLRRVGL
jgi:TolB-like protein/DNA-binding winged helix-turn-helix (wHTH) protein